MVQRVTEVVGVHPESIAHAVQNAVTTASHTVRDMRWFRLAEVEGAIHDGKVTEFRALVRIYFDYDEKGHP